MVDRKMKATLFALLAASFYALNVPFSKQLLQKIPPTLMASFLYFGAGVGVGLMYLFHWGKEKKQDRLAREDLPYTIGMVILDILAPILLMLGISIGSSANASLLGNFEIVATALIALLAFKEKISNKLWTAIALITISAQFCLLRVAEVFSFLLVPSLFYLLPYAGGWRITVPGGFRKSTYQIVTIKGLCCGMGSFVIEIAGESLPKIEYVILAMALGFVAYGLSILCILEPSVTWVRQRRVRIILLHHL